MEQYKKCYEYRLANITATASSPAQCPCCRGYRLESRWCYVCKGTGVVHYMTTTAIKPGKVQTSKENGVKQKEYSPLISDETKMFITEEHPPTPRFVVCAANRIGDVILCGARHWDNVMHAQADAMNIDDRKAEQGFIDQFGVFMSRDEALEVVSKNGQKLKRPIDTYDTLYSENLY